LDSLDIKIIRRLRAAGRSEFDPFPTTINSLRKVASDLKIDKDTVRRRLARLAQQGIFLGWSSMINPNALSLKAERVWLRFQNEEDKKKGSNALSRIRNIRTITIYFGNSLSFVFAGNDLTALKNYLHELSTQISEFSLIRESVISFPESKRSLSSSDRKLYEAVRNSFERPQHEISRETGFSLRTVKRRFGDLTKSKTILLLSSWNPKKIKGAALEIYVNSSNQKAFDRLTSRISSKFDNSLLTIEPYEDDNSSTFYFVTENIFEANDCLEFVKSQPESIDVESYLTQDVLRVREQMRL
jgi:DNA-binding Lrp family transcriptional regulator